MKEVLVVNITRCQNEKGEAILSVLDGGVSLLNLTSVYSLEQAEAALVCKLARCRLQNKWRIELSMDSTFPGQFCPSGLCCCTEGNRHQQTQRVTCSQRKCSAATCHRERNLETGTLSNGWTFQTQAWRFLYREFESNHRHDRFLRSKIRIQLS